MKKLRLRFAASAVALALVGIAREAGALERQHHLGLGPTFGSLNVDGKSTTSQGLGGTLHYAYGLNDQFNLTVGMSHVVVAANQEQDSPSSPLTRPATVGYASVGAAYVIDILRWVPYLGLEAGAYRLGGGTLPSPLIVPGASVAFGLDYQLNRSVALGLVGRQHLLVSKVSTYPSYTTATLRIEYMWGY